jgi:uncharacterized membrane protein
MTLPVLAESSPLKTQFSRIGVILMGGAVMLIWLMGTPDGLLGKADAIGYAVCHRIDLRSFHLGERVLPLCARCSGMYLGILISITYFSLRRRKAALFPPKRIILLLGIIFIGYVIDGVNSYLHLLPLDISLYEPHNFLRLTTGFLFGIALSSFVYPAFNQSVWREPAYVPALRSLNDLLILVGLGAILILIVMVENPIFLYPLALLSSAAVFMLLTIVYTLFLLMIFKRENRADNLKDLSLVLFIGLTFSIVQIGLFDLIRYTIFGTWGGFNFG